MILMLADALLAAILGKVFFGITLAPSRDRRRTRPVAEETIRRHVQPDFALA